MAKKTIKGELLYWWEYEGDIGFNQAKTMYMKFARELKGKAPLDSHVGMTISRILKGNGHKLGEPGSTVLWRFGKGFKELSKAEANIDMTDFNVVDLVEENKKLQTLLDSCQRSYTKTTQSYDKLKKELIYNKECTELIIDNNKRLEEDIRYLEENEMFLKDPVGSLRIYCKEMLNEYKMEDRVLEIVKSELERILFKDDNHLMRYVRSCISDVIPQVLGNLYKDVADSFDK